MIKAKLIEDRELDAGYFQSRWTTLLASDSPALGSTLSLDSQHDSQRYVVVDFIGDDLSLISRHPSKSTSTFAVTNSELSVKSHQIYLLYNEALFTSLALSQLIEQAGYQSHSLVLLESVHPWPFRPQPSLLYLPNMPPQVIASVPLLDDKKIPSRLCHPSGSPGCFEESAATLAEIWLSRLTPSERKRWTVATLGY